MKNIKKILFITLSAAVLLFTACKNSVTSATVKGEGITAEKTVTLNLSANGDYTIFSTKNNSSRTIVSNPYTASQLKFYMYGTNTTKGTYVGLEEITVSSTDGKTGTASLEIGSYVWELTIVAYPTASAPATPLTVYAPTNETSILADAVLVGKASADLRGDTNSVDFILMPDGLTKQGDISIKLYTVGWTMDNKYKAKVSIVDHTSGDEIYTLSEPKATGSTEQTFLIDENDNTKTLIPDSEPSTANYTAGGAHITPGNNYDLVVEFEAPSTKKYYWSDNLIVLPGKGNSETVKIPATIMLPPNPPTDVKAGYIEPGIDTTALYEVEFTWTRSAGYTEKYYELEIADLGVPDANLDDDNSNDVTYENPTTDTEWETQVFKPAEGSNPKVDGYSSITTVERYGMDFYQNQSIWVAGSLLKGNQTATVKLALGNRYFARIRAVNDAGESAWAYVDLDGTGNTGINAFTSNPKTINLFKITYQKTDPNGRTATYTSTPAFENIQYYCQNSTTGIEIAVPKRNANDTSTLEVIDSTSAYWKYWKDYPTKEDGDPENYKGFTNLTLIPVFAKNSTVTIFNDAENLLTINNITLTNGVQNGSYTVPAINANNYVSINKGSDGTTALQWGLKDAAGTETEPGLKDLNEILDYCYLTIAKTRYPGSYLYNQYLDRTSLKFPVMDLSEFDPDIYSVVIHYSIDGSKEYTYTPISVAFIE